MKNEDRLYRSATGFTVLPDGVMTNKRIIICQPKILGLSMNFMIILGMKLKVLFCKENILGSEFSFTTNKYGGFYRLYS
jgi:hypothetical protein